jgi:hypothetical protein
MKTHPSCLDHGGCTSGALWEHHVTEPLKKKVSTWNVYHPAATFVVIHAVLCQYPTLRELRQVMQAEHWGQLIEHSLGAYKQIRLIPDGEEPILRENVEQLVGAFRAFRVVPV